MATHVEAVESERRALVVTGLYVNESGPLFVRITGRKPGVLSWVLTKLGLSSTVVFSVGEKTVEYADESVSGNVVKSIPFSTVCNVESGFLKPFVYLFLAVVSLPLAVFTSGISIAVSLVLAFMYWFGRSLKVCLVPQSGVKLEFSFKRSVIEWVNISETDAGRIIDILNDRVRANP